MKCKFCGLGESTSTNGVGCGWCQVHRLASVEAGIAQQQANVQAQAAGNIDRALYANQISNAREAQQAQASAAAQAHGHIPFAQRVQISKVIDGQTADLEAARKRIAELEDQNGHLTGWREAAIKVQERANRLSDEAGALRTERDELLRENAVLRRSLERAERKGKR